MENLFKYKFYVIRYTQLPEKVIKKSDCFQEIPASKKVFFRKSGCSEKVPALEKYMFWIITYSGEKPLRNSSCA